MSAWVTIDEDYDAGFVEVTEATATPQQAIEAFKRWVEDERIIRLGAPDEVDVTRAQWYAPNEDEDAFELAEEGAAGAVRMWVVDLSLAEVDSR